ncbi:DgyrCDS5993 [Dimorphilus gyrociliatus]|uniref:DgyrCDS5993 n=1 Tax=Dimorphilus gyrociliatus TaxID=2664684 RepID=A0A7I8VN93_9ANNE|nr:DgyrCDS5993 [Dimorphilus gyrociliatus]
MSNEIRTIDVSQLSEAVNILSTLPQSHQSENEYQLDADRPESISDQQIIVLDNNFLKLMEESTNTNDSTSEQVEAVESVVTIESTSDLKNLARKPDRKIRPDKPLPVTLLVPAKNNRKNYFHVKKLYIDNCDSRVNITEDEDDTTNNFSGSYCIHCDKYFDETKKCTQHCVMFKHVKDTPIQCKALITLPSVLTYSPQYGIRARIPLNEGTKFGPLDGRREPSSSNIYENSHVWKVFTDSFKYFYLDLNDDQQSNWMRYLKRAIRSSEVNLIAYQEKENIYMVTKRRIKKDEQLLYWYSGRYADLLGIFQTPEDSYRCTLCQKIFADESTLKNHTKYKHSNGSGKLECRICGLKCVSQTRLDMHLNTHNGTKPFHCSECDKTFGDLSEKKHVCKECGKAFRQKTHLKSHSLIHTGERRLQCTFCGKRFSRYSDLKVHENKHTRSKIFKCPVQGCSSEFLRSWTRRDHMAKLHEDEYDCNFCDERVNDGVEHLKSCIGV